MREVLRYHSTAWSAREVRETITVELRCLMPIPTPTTTTTTTKTTSKTAKSLLTAKAAALLATTRVYELRKGAIVAMPSSLLHHDPATHARPNVFDARRFLAVSHGGQGTAADSATLRPLRRGAIYCPGRLFAKRQVVGFLAGVAAGFDVGAAVEGEGGEEVQVQVPRNADFFYVAGQRAVEVQVRRRE